MFIDVNRYVCISLIGFKSHTDQLINELALLFYSYFLSIFSKYDRENTFLRISLLFRKRIIYHSRNSAGNDINVSPDGEQTMQMFSSNDRSRNRKNTVPFILQQKHRPGNISVSKYQEPIDMENQYQRLDFSMRSDLNEVHDDNAMQFYKRTSTPAVTEDNSKPLKKAGLTKGTIDLKEVYNNYSLPYDALSHQLVGNDDTRLQIKTRPSVTTKDEKHTNVAYCDTAIVHEDFLYDVPKHFSKFLDNR